jgi:hypothetical protein
MLARAPSITIKAAAGRVERISASRNSQARVLGFHAGANSGRLLRATVLGMRTSLKF